LRPDWSRSRWLDDAGEYGLQHVTRVRGWRDLQDARSPGYASNQAYLGRRAVQGF
jgi:hypothetical protein